VAVSIANALTAEGAADESGLGYLTRKAAIFAGAIFVPLTLLLFIESRTILRLFGAEYASEGVVLMRLLAVGLIPFAFTSLYMAALRVRRQIRRLIFLAALFSGLSLTLAIALIPELGIEGAGAAWLVAQAAVAGAAMAMSWLNSPKPRAAYRGS
jgi:O-antigen/teichoic acid export membrane protein